MPINSEVSAMFPEKLCKSTAAAPTSTSASTPSSSLSSKGNGQNEQQTTVTSSSANKQIENSLIKHQGQKWQQYFEFEKMLKMIRIAEKHLRSKGDGSSSSSSNGKSSNSPNINTVSPPKVVNASSLKCSRPLKQVQRLNGNDMHYYGIVPKQTAMDVIVCSVCHGIYTKVGFNNHMMLQHPAMWSTISTKLVPAASGSDAYSLIANDNSQDCIRDVTTAGAEIVGSPSDLSGIMSTSSNASSSSSSLSSSTYAATPRYKSSKMGSTAGSSSSSTNSSGASRSRSKQTKHSSNVVTSGIHSSNPSSEAGQLSSKSSKKNSSASSTSSAAAVANTPVTLNTGSADPAQAITIYSSSSNSSCSLPPTPKMVNVGGADIAGPTGTQDNTLCPASLLSLHESKDKVTADSTATFVVSSKKKVKSPTFAVHESVDSSASNSSSEYDQASSNGTVTSSKSSQVPFVVGSKEVTGSTPVSAKLAGVRELNCFDAQINELHQAVSSITDGKEDNKNNICTEGMAAPNLNTGGSSFPIQPSTTIENSAKLQAVVPAVPSALAQNYTLQDMTQTNEEIMPHNTSDENSMLTLEDVLDSKFLNEILNTTESEIHFDENELDTAAQQTYQQSQPSGTKRMRYDESVMGQSHQPAVTEMPGDFNSYQQQQVQQQYGHYDTGNLEDIKVFGAPQQPSMDAQYQAQYGKALQQQQPDQQQQLTTIDAIQLQQLLYQQQNMNVYAGNLDPTTSSAVQHQPQFDQNSMVSTKHIIDLCSTEDLQKSKGLGLAMNSNDFSAMTSINSTFEGNACGYDAVTPHFQLFNVPSLTDDMSEEVNMLVPSVVDGVPRTAQQYVLPSSEEHLIYEITDNNQVAVMSQQRQQQVIAEFLTQANYDNIGHINNNGSIDNIGGITNPTASALTVVNGKDAWDDPSNDLMDFDFSHIETVKSLTGSNATAIDSKSVKTENSRYCDDFYFNVFIYAGIPRPLSINCFGLVKLPLCAATTFRKHLLSARKANNSPITLGGGINGMVGNNASATSTRLTNVNSKSLPNYFSNLSGGNSGCNTAMGNEFSIGSITITNSPISQQQVYAYPKQMGIGNGGGNSGVEITFNTSTTNGSATSPVSAFHRSRSKTNNVSISTASGAGRNKSQGSSAPFAVVTPTNRFTTRSNMNNAKTIYVCSTPANMNDRVKFIKRGALLACKAEVAKKHKFSSRQIADILGNVGKGGNLKQQLALQQNIAVDGSNEALVDEQIRLNRVNHFYERRRKLLDLTCNARQEQYKEQQPQQLKQKLLKQQLFSRMFSDYGIGSLPHCKSSNSNSSGSSDTVRVFV